VHAQGMYASWFGSLYCLLSSAFNSGCHLQRASRSLALLHKAASAAQSIMGYLPQFCHADTDTVFSSSYFPCSFLSYFLFRSLPPSVTLSLSFILYLPCPLLPSHSIFLSP